MLKLYVLSDDFLSSTLIRMITGHSNLNLALVSCELSNFIQLELDPMVTNLIIIERRINPALLAEVTRALLSKFSFVIYMRNINEGIINYENVHFYPHGISISDIEKLSNKKSDSHSKPSKQLPINRYKSTFFLRCENNKIRKICLDDIYAIEANLNYIKFHSLNEVFTVNLTLRAVEDILPSDVFIRIHRSFIVNVKSVVIVEPMKICVAKNLWFPIGQSYKKSVLNYFYSKVINPKKDNFV